MKSLSFKENTPIFYPTDDPFVVRFKVEPLAWLAKEKAIPIRDDRVWNTLSFTRGREKELSQWTSTLRTSLKQLDDSDARFIEEFVFLQANNGQVFEIDKQKHPVSLSCTAHQL